MPEYGAVVPFRFTVRNPGTVPYFVRKVEALTGRRWTVAAPLSVDTIATVPVEPPGHTTGELTVVHSGLLLPGQEVAFDLPYRVLADEERFAIEIETVTSQDFPCGVLFPAAGRSGKVDGDVAGYADIGPDPARRAVHYAPGRRFGDFRALGAVTRIPSLPMPFEPWIRDLHAEAWTYCLALRGFVVRLSASTFLLVRADSQDPMPGLDFEFLQDLDTSPEGVTVTLATGEPFLVTAGNAYPFLRDLLLAGLRLAAAPPGGPRWLVGR